jgi:hypothetical protein
MTLPTLGDGMETDDPVETLMRRVLAYLYDNEEDGKAIVDIREFRETFAKELRGG